MPLNPSEILNNRYRIIKLLGQGGFGAIYRAWDMNLHKACAVKENLDVSAALAAQFMREATILASLAHPNLPRVIDYFALPEHGQYLVMDFVEGENLETRVIKVGPVGYPQAVFWVGQIADALDYLHNQPLPLIHRDIKPANIIITPTGQAMLVDFGLVKIYDLHARTTKGARGITAGYSPPEQYGAEKTDARTDIYSLATTLYTLLTGTIPVESVDILAGSARHPAAAHLVNPQLPAALSAAIVQGMALDPSKRFPTAGEFKAAIYAAIPTQSWGSQPSPVGLPATPAPQGTPPSATTVRPPSSQPAGSLAARLAYQPRRRPAWTLFGIGGCVLFLILLLLGAAGLWGLCAYLNTLNILKPSTPIMHNGSYEILSADNMEAYSAILQGDALNHLRFDWVGDTLTLYTNSELLISVNDSDLRRGDVSLIAGTFDPDGVDIIFDNNMVYLP